MNSRILAFSLALLPTVAFAQSSTTTLRTDVGDQPDSGFGHTIVAADDLDGDGIDDYWLGRPRFGSTPSGAVEARSGRDGTVLYRLRSGDDDAQFGFAMTRCGDVDQDGIDDLVVGAPFHGTGHGLLLCFSGARRVVLWGHAGGTPNTLLGSSLATVYSAGGSPTGDIMAGAPGTAGVASRVSLLSGTTGLPLQTVSAPAHHRLGTAIAALGDVAAVGAPGSGPNGEGSVRFFRANGTSLVEWPAYLSLDPGAGIGRSIAAYPTTSTQFVLGGVGATGTGRIDVVVPSRFGSARVATMTSLRAGDGFGTSLAADQDIDADGHPDILVGAPFDAAIGGAGMLHVISGASFSRSTVVPSPSRDNYGSTVAYLGDLDGDRLPEIAVSAPRRDVAGAPRAGAVDIARVDVSSAVIAYGFDCARVTFAAARTGIHPGGTVEFVADGLVANTFGSWFIGPDRISNSLSTLGMPRCFLNTTPTLLFPLVASATGQARLNVPLPATPSLVLEEFHTQFAAVDAGANAFGLVTSHGLRLRIGHR